MRAWEKIAGEPIARRTEVRVRRGVLEIDIMDASWAETLAELAPRLASRLAGACPDLALRRFRMRCEGSAGGKPVTGAIVEPETWVPGVPTGRPAPSRFGRRHDSTPATGDPARRLRSVMERYLQRAGAARSRVQKP